MALRPHTMLHASGSTVGAELTGSTAVSPVAKNPELALIDSYFAKHHYPDRFDGFGRSNDHSNDYFDPRIHPESARTRGCVSIEAVAFNEIVQDAEMIYVPCGISSGLRVHELLDKKNRSQPKGSKDLAVSTYKAEEHLAGTVHGQAMHQNKDDNLRRAAIVSRMYPDKMVVAPVMREAAVRALKNYAFSGGQRYEEEDFMALWYPVIDRCKMMVLDGDWNFSRNSIWEMMRGMLIQAGQVSSRPGADMEVVDLEGHQVSMLVRAEKMAEMLEYQLGKGFEPREAATALAQIFTLDDDIRAGHIPAEGRSLHPMLKDRPREELMAMDRLKAKFKPLLLAHCAKFMRLDDLPEEYQAATAKSRKLPEKLRGIFRHIADGISDRMDKILSVEPSGELRAEQARIQALPKRLFDSYEHFFEKRSCAKMFEDHLYRKLPEWERLALPFAIGGTEIGLYPNAHPMATAIFTDLKRGKAGFTRAQASGAENMQEVAGVLGRGIGEVTSENAREAEALKAKLKAENPGTIVVNTLSFLRIADAIECFRNVHYAGRFVAAPGASETSPQMRLTLQMKYLDRNVDRAVFQEGWERSNDLVQLRVRARLIQAGMIERPAGAQSTLTVTSAADPAMPETLLHDITLLTQEVRRASFANVRAPEQALALARLVTLHELSVDPSLRRMGDGQTRDPINTLTAPDSLGSYDQAEAKAITQEAKRLLTTRALFVQGKDGNEKDGRLIPRERLYVEPDASDDVDRAALKAVQNSRMEEYIHAQDSLCGKQQLAKQRTASDTVHVASTGARR